MKVFEKEYGKIFISDEEKKISEEYSKFLENIKKLNYTEIDNRGDILDDNNSELITLICKNKTSKQILIQKQNEITKDSTTFLGRKTKDCTGTGKHGAEAKDNQRDRKIQSSVAYLRQIASDECTKCNVDIFEEPNIKSQFGSNFVQNLSFLNTKFYKILCFQKDFKDDFANHRNKRLKNRNIIMQMLGKENNEFFVYLMKAKLSDYEEIGEKIKEHLSLKENDEKLNDFKNKVKSLITEIKSNLNKARNKENKKIDYITIDNLED